MKKKQKSLKERLYFLGARYLGFFAKQRLQAWNPKVVVVTGSAGKTTAFNLIEAQLGKRAFYSYNANSAYGIPFNILGIERQDYSKREWLKIFWQAPFLVRKPLPKQGIYIAECDCDRPGEGEFLAELLEPDIVLWLNSYGTHGMNFDNLVEKGEFKTTKEAIAYEYGWLAAGAHEMVLASGDSALIGTELTRVKKGVKTIKFAEKDYLSNYEISNTGTTFVFKGAKIKIGGALLPQAAWLAIVMTRKLAEVLGAKFDPKFTNYKGAPGRLNLFKGVRGTTLIDSTYNASPTTVREVLASFEKLPSKSGKAKWLVLSEMLEQGEAEEVEHRALAKEIERAVDARTINRVLLTGALIKKYTVPELEERNVPYLYFSGLAEIYVYLMNNLSGGEMILFKGGRLMEGVIERLLLYPEKDTAKLSWRGELYERRRQKALAELERMDLREELERTREERREARLVAGRRDKGVQKKVEGKEGERTEKGEERVRNQGIRKKKTVLIVGKTDREVERKLRPEIVIVPGWNRDESGFGGKAGVGAAWEKAGWQVTILKVPGLTGEKIGEEQGWSLADYARWLKAKLRGKIGQGREVYLVGHSAGGRIILKYLIEGGEDLVGKLRGVILVDSAGVDDERKWVKERRKLVEKIDREEGKNKRRLTEGLRQVAFIDEPELRKTWLNLNNEDLSWDLKEIGVRTLVVWGEDDHETPLEMGREIARRIVGAKLAIISGAKHRPQTEKQKEFLGVTGEFLK